MSLSDVSDENLPSMTVEEDEENIKRLPIKLTTSGAYVDGYPETVYTDLNEVFRAARRLYTET